MAERAATSESVFVTDAPAPGELAVVSDGLDEFNLQQVGIQDQRPLAVLVRDDNGRVVGGLTGRTYLGLWFVDLFYLPERLRGSGLGAEVLRRAEAEAVRRGCRSGVLYTIKFQAPGFYEKQGWRAFGEVPGDPPAATRVFLSKQLQS
jgi:GNAT superfamily N-acetyltransferase